MVEKYELTASDGRDGADFRVVAENLAVAPTPGAASLRQSF
jgi:hypothetical protein